MGEAYIWEDQDKMTDTTLIIGNKNYSSWSLRGWLAVKTSGLTFEEKIVPLFEDNHAETMARETPASKVPVLIHNGYTIWESLAIAEYVAELKPEAKMWPDDAGSRAEARSIACEMLSGFTGLRSQYHMNCRKIISNTEPTDACKADIARIQKIWQDCLTKHGGPFLFGEFSIADIMYAPVVSRFKTYQVQADETIQAYMDAILGLSAMQEWYAAAEVETWVIEEEEY
jgi:glutathione S-transferase